MKTIVWDVDDVLLPLMSLWFDSIKSSFLKRDLKYSDIQKNPPYSIFNMSQQTYHESLDAFRASSLCLESKPNDLILQWFQSQGHRAYHFVLTKRPLKSVHELSRWVFLHFGRWVRGFGFVPSERESDPKNTYEKTKKEYFRRLGQVDLFIDDSEDNLAPLRAEVDCLLFPQPWNDNKQSQEDFLSELTLRLN